MNDDLLTILRDIREELRIIRAEAQIRALGLRPEELESAYSARRPFRPLKQRKSLVRQLESADIAGRSLADKAAVTARRQLNGESAPLLAPSAIDGAPSSTMSLEEFEHRVRAIIQDLL